jgi:serine/threonine protein kinase/WD40 repeat protein
MAVEAARAKSLFLVASDISDPAERAAYLERECADDVEVRARVEALLRANDAGPLLPGTVKEGTGTQDPQRLPATVELIDSAAALGTVIAGKYKLIEVIGEGGMGCVYLARQTEPVQRTVAVKLIQPGMDSRAVLARFEAERQVLAVMDHPNIAKILDGGLHDSRPFFVMELVKGTPITTFCDQRKLTPRERMELFVPVCQAIQHAHQKGIIHRDIKPPNVLVALYDDRAVPKVIDFGVAKATGPALTEESVYTAFGAIVGTPEYMSPEQASLNNLDIDTRSDVYALGVLLYELLTGTTPVDRKQLGQAALLEVLRIVREVEAPKPSTKLSSSEALPSIAANRNTEPAKLSRLLKEELDWILLKALEKDRARRYESANGFAADIQRYLAGEPVQAVPPSTAYRLQKFLKRNKVQVTAAVIVVLALVAGTVAATIGLLEARRQRDDADFARGDATRELRNATRANKALETSQGELQKTNQTLRASQRELGNTLYATRMTLMRNALEAKDYFRAMELLDQTYPAGGADDPAGFEWHYWDRKLRPYLGKFYSNYWSTPAFSRDGRRCLSTGSVADVASGRILLRFDAEGTAPRPSLDLSPDGTLVAGIGTRGRTDADRDIKRIQAWNVDSGAEVVNFEVATKIPGGISVCRLGPDKRTFAAAIFGPAKTQIIAWDLTTKKELFARQLAPRTIASLAFNRAGTELVVLTGTFWAKPVSLIGKWHHTKGVAGSVEIWDGATGKTRVVLAGPFPDGVASAAFSPDGRLLATAQLQWHSVQPLVAKPSLVKLWDAVTGKEVRTMAPLPALPEKDTQNFNFSLAFSPTGDRLAAGWIQGSRLGGENEIQRVQVWDVATGETRCQLKDYDTLGDRVAVCFGGPGGELLYVAGAGGRIYDGLQDDRRKIPRILPPVRVAVPGMFPLESVCNPGGDRFATLWSNENPTPGGPKAEPVAEPKLELRVNDATGRELFHIAELADPPPAKGEPKGITTAVIGRKVFFSPDSRKIACLVTHANGPIARYREIIAAHRSIRFVGPKPGRQEALRKLAKSVVHSRLWVWDLESGKELHGLDVTIAFPSPELLPISDAFFTPDGTRLTAIRQLLPSDKPNRIQELRTEGEISVKDAKVLGHGDTFFKAYPYQMEAGKLYRIDFVSKEDDASKKPQERFDPFLRLEDPSGKIVAQDDDGGGFPNARILYKAAVSGVHKIVCTTVFPRMFGRFALTVTGSSPAELANVGQIPGGSQIKTWEVATGRETANFTRDDVLFNHGVYAPDGKTMILAGRIREHYRRVDAQTGRDLEQIPINLRDGVRVQVDEPGWAGNGPYQDYDTSTHPQVRLFVSSDGKQFYHRNGAGPVGDSERTGREITLFDFAHVREPVQYNLDFKIGVQCVTVSPDSRRVVASYGIQGKSPAGRLVIWDRESRLQLAQIELPGPVRDLAFTPDSQRLGCLFTVDQGRAVEFHLLDGSPQQGRTALGQLRR